MLYFNSNLVATLSLVAILLAVTLLFAVAVSAQNTATVRGQITHSNGRPAVNVRVSLAQKIRFTDARGGFQISGIPFGTHNMQIHKNEELLHEVRVEVNQPVVNKNVRLP